MASLGDVGRLALALPGVTESERRGTRTWLIGKKTFAWERPFTKADIRRFGDVVPPDGPIVAVRVADLLEKEAVLSSSSDAVFTMAHFDGFAALLIQLKTVTRDELAASVLDGWLACAPRTLADDYMHDR